MAFFDAGEDRGLDEVAVRERAFGETPAAAQWLAALLAADLDVAQVGFHLPLVDARADVDAGLHAVANFELLRALDHGGDEAIVDGVLDNGAAGGGAFLAGGKERGVDHVFHGGSEVRVGQDDGGILAAHFELDAEMARGSLLVKPLSDFARAGERDGLERRGVNQCLAERAAGAGHEVDHAFGNAGFVERFDDAPGAEGRGGGRLDEHGVAADERRGELPGGDGAGEIPRRNEADYADGFAQREHVDAVALGGHQHAGHARPFAAEIAEDIDGAAYFALGFGQRLAFLAGHVGGHLLEFPVEDVGGFEEDVAARGAAQSAPGGQGGGSGSGGVGDVLRAAFDEVAD